MSFKILSKQKLTEFSRLKEKKYRKEFGQFLIEGTRLFQEFLNSRFELSWIVITDSFQKKFGELVKPIQRHYAEQCFLSTEDKLAKISDTENAQGIVAAVKKPSQSEFFWNAESKTVLVCDRISDPGNLGTIMRNADWFGVKEVLLSASCVEAYNPKVVRATMGSIFRLNIFEQQDLSRILKSAKSEGYTTLAADATGDEIIKHVKKTVLILGSEANGISSELLALSDRRVAIARIGGGESLNASVASGILLHELTRVEK